MGILRPEHREALGNPDAGIATVLKSLPADAHGRDEIPGLEALLKRGRPGVAAEELPGEWKVRSIQAGNLGIFSYPFFNAKIREVAGMLVFEKTSGSQRRSGLLLPLGNHFALVGGKTVNDEPQRPYSNLGGERESDTIGTLVKIGPGELLILLDISDSNFEIYHLKKP